MGGDSSAARMREPEPEGARATRGYSYQVQVHPASGILRRWRGRVVTTDPQGRRRYWRWRHGFSKARLMASLWEETMRDIQWRTGHHTVEVVEPAE